MKALLRVSGGRWSATVGNFKRGSFGDEDITLGVEFHCDGEPIVCNGFSMSIKDVAAKRRRAAGKVVAYADLFGFSLSKLDREDLRWLVATADALCVSIQQGGSAEGWCTRQGLRAVRELARGRPRPGRLVIHVRDKTFVLSRWRFCGTRLVQR
jgi:hypothetical protein